jgi:hypothetical protein
MRNSIGSAALQTPDNSLPSRSQGQAKADLIRDAAKTEFSEVFKSAARKVFGKQELAAAALGKSPGTFSRDVDAGTIRTGELAALGPEMLAEVGRELCARYADLVSPSARKQRLIRDMRAALDELDQIEP